MYIKILILYISIISIFSQETIKLPEPKKSGGMPINKAFNLRASSRDFINSEHLSLEQLSQALWACYGINREDGGRTVPSSKGSYPFDVYLFRYNGIYKYDPIKHEINLYKEGDHRKESGFNDYIVNADTNVCLIGSYEKLAYLKHLSVMQATMRIDAGYCTANMYMVCASEGLKCVSRAGINHYGILSVLDLSQEMWSTTLCYSIGK